MSEKQLTVGRRYLVDSAICRDIQRPFFVTYDGEVEVMVWQYIDWYSKQFSDPFLRVRPDDAEALAKFKPVDDTPPATQAGWCDRYRVPSGMGGTFLVQFVGLKTANQFVNDGGMRIVLSEERAQKVAENPMEE